MYGASVRYSTTVGFLKSKGRPRHRRVALDCLVCRSVGGDFRPLRGTAIAFLICEAAMDKTRTRWNELADNHVLLQAEERVGCRTNCRARQHFDSVLE